jgi:hypothetical protein
MPDSIQLFHYYDACYGPFLSMSELSLEEAEQLQEQQRRLGRGLASKRASDYCKIRRELEMRVRELFIAKGGKPRRLTPHYFTVGPCDWLLRWFSQPHVITLELSHFDPDQVSFTYGDMFPAMRYQDGRPYRAKVYTVAELAELIGQYGLPQEWNSDGSHGPERYIEAQVWDYDVLAAYRPLVSSIFHPPSIGHEWKPNSHNSLAK